MPMTKRRGRERMRLAAGKSARDNEITSGARTHTTRKPQRLYYSIPLFPLGSPITGHVVAFSDPFGLLRGGPHAEHAKPKFFRFLQLVPV